jgi:hypothetical protein
MRYAYIDFDKISYKEGLNMPVQNSNALTAIGMFLGALFVAKLVIKIRKGDLPGGKIWVFYLRMLLGFLIAGAIILGLYSFAGVD